jgi:hypothetical protein
MSGPPAGTISDSSNIVLEPVESDRKRDLERNHPLKDAEKEQENANVEIPTVREFLVGWEEPEDKDPANPLNWSQGRKWGIIAVLSSITFLTYAVTHVFVAG